MIRGHNLSGAEKLGRRPVSMSFTHFGGFSLLNRHRYRHQGRAWISWLTPSRESASRMSLVTLEEDGALLLIGMNRPRGVYREGLYCRTAGSSRCRARAV